MSLLTGPLVDAGWIRAVSWSNLEGAPQSVWTAWCTDRPLAESVSLAFTIKVNRCVSNALGPAGFAFESTTAGRFSLVQYNGTHFEHIECDDSRCSANCTVVREPRGTRCRERVFTSSSTATFNLITGEQWVDDLFTLPSPSYCLRVSANSDCSGEVILQMCLTQCALTNRNALVRFACDGGSVVTSTCPFGSNPAAAFLSCVSSREPCPGPPPSDLPTLPAGCSVIPESGFGYRTLGCTFSGASDTSTAPIAAFDCAGMSGQARAQCNGASASVDASSKRDIVGSWSPSNVADSTLTLRSPPLNSSALHVRGRLTPAGRLQLSFPTRAALDAAIAAGPLPVITFNQPMAGSATAFVSAVATVEGSTQSFCVAQSSSATALSITISAAACDGNKLSDAAIAGIAVGGAVLVAAVVVAVVGVLWSRRKQNQAMQSLRERLMDGE